MYTHTKNTIEKYAHTHDAKLSMYSRPLERIHPYVYSFFNKTTVELILVDVETKEEIFVEAYVHGFQESGRISKIFCQDKESKCMLTIKWGDSIDSSAVSVTVSKK